MDADAVRLGMVRLTDAAPLVYAQAHGMFAASGLHVTLVVEPSWANLADKLAWGVLDGAVMLPPLAMAMTLGLREKVTQLLIPAGVSRNGNAITLASALAEPMLRGGRPSTAQTAARLRPALPLRFAVVHAFSPHDLLLRSFLESGGITPGDVAITVIPPPDMVGALAEGRIDGFCAGAPWAAVAAAAGVGATIAVSSDIEPNHPEKCLAVRAEWAEAHPSELRSLLRGFTRAALACNDPANGPELAELLSRPEWVGVPATLIAASLPGGVGGDVDRSLFATYPDPADGAWFLQLMARWRPLPEDADAIVRAMYRPDLYADALASSDQ